MSELSQSEREEIARMRAAVLEHVPEVRPHIAELVKESLIDGWRNVTYVGPPRQLGVSAVIYLEHSKSFEVKP